MDRQPPDSRQQAVGIDDLVVLRGDELDPRVEQRLLRVEDVERGALADLGLLAHAGERDFRRFDLRLRGAQDAARILIRAPGRDHRGADLVALQVGLQLLLAELFLGLARRRVVSAAVVDRDA